MKKRTITTILAAAMTCLVFAGCGSSKAADTASKEADSPKSVEVTATPEVTPAETTPAEAAPDEVTAELPEGEVDVVLDEGIDKYEGSWFEEIAGRGSMEISPSGDGKYYIFRDGKYTGAYTDETRFTGRTSIEEFYLKFIAFSIKK